MSYLRPLYTDAAARAANHNFVSVYPPACLPIESDLGVAGKGTLPGNASQGDRVPSQRPIDRRWDQSRGLAFARQPRNALKDYTWSLREGITFARKNETRRTYAVRSLRPPPPPKEKAQQESTARTQTQSTPPRAYGNALPSLSRAPTSATNTPQSSKQQEMQRQIEKLKTVLNLVKGSEEDLRLKTIDLEVQLNESKLEAKRDIESAYTRGRKKAESDVQLEFRNLQKERDNAISESAGLSSTIAELRNDYQKLEKEMEKTVSDMDDNMKKQKAAWSTEKIRINREVQALEDKHRSELGRARNAVQSRKEQRKDYPSYREIFQRVFDDRYAFTDTLLGVNSVAARTGYEARDQLKALRTFCETHPGTGQIGKQVVDMASQQLITAERTFQELKTPRHEMTTLEDTLKEDSHNSRALTNTLRFREHRDDTRLTDNMNRFLGEIPLSNVFSLTRRRLAELSKDIERATNSTVREELARDVLDVKALQGPLRVFGQVLSTERERQKYESWKRAPYIRKVTLVRQDQFTKQIKSLNTAFRKEILDMEPPGMSPKRYQARRQILLEYRAISSSLRTDDRKLEEMLTKKAQMDVALKRMDRAEAAIDKQIDAMIAANEEEMMERLRDLFGDVKGFRALRSRDPAAVATGPSSTRQKVPGFAPALPLTSSKYDMEMRVVVAKRALERPGDIRNETERKLAEKQLEGATREVIEADLDILRRKLQNSSHGNEEQRRNWSSKVPHLEAVLKKRREMRGAALKKPDGLKSSNDGTLASAAAVAQPRDGSNSTGPAKPAEGIASSSERAFDTLKKTLHVEASVARRRPSIRRNVLSRQAPRGPSFRRAYSTGALHASPQHVNDATHGYNTVASRQHPRHSEQMLKTDSRDHQDELASYREASAHEPLQIATTSSTSPAMDSLTDDTLSSSEQSEHSFEDANSIAEPSTASEDEETPLAFHIPAAEYRTAIMASKTTSAAFWKYSLYKNAEGNAPVTHYCTTFEQTEAQMAKFKNDKVVGFDLEWELHAYPGKHSIKRCVSLIQIAAEDRIGLFQVGMFKGDDKPDELMPTVLREFLENPNIIKAGVNISNDAARIRACFGVEMRGIFELSRLYKVVTFSQSQPHKVNRKLVKLADQVQNILLLPLSKGDVRTSSWSKRLTPQQIEYAVSDAYAGLRLFHALEARRKAMDPRPPRPAVWELDLPLVLGDGTVVTSRPRATRQPAVAAEKPAEDEEDSEDEEFFDAMENLDPCELDTDKAEVSCPGLPSLEGLSTSEDTPNEAGRENPVPSLGAPTQLQPATESFIPAKATTAQDQSTELASASTWATTHLSGRPTSDRTTASLPTRPRLLLAYHVWHYQGFDIKGTAALLRDPPLAMATVASYIAEAIKKEQLPFDSERAKEVLGILPKSVHGRYPSIVAKIDEGERTE